MKVTIYLVVWDDEVNTGALAFGTQNARDKHLLSIMRSYEGEDAKLDELLAQATVGEAWDYWLENVKKDIDTYYCDEQEVELPETLKSHDTLCPHRVGGECLCGASEHNEKIYSADAPA